MRVALPTLLLLSLGHACLGQGAAPALAGQQRPPTAASPPLPLLGLLGSLPKHSSLDDSLARRYYARNRVKTVAVVRLAADGMVLDTLDYMELDRAGYPVLTAKPSFGARSHLVYNKRHEVISYTKDAEHGFAMMMQVTYDPATRTTTLRVGPTLATLALYEIGHDAPRGKEGEFEAFFVAAPGLPPPPVSRILLTKKRVNGDTTRLDLLGYRNEQVVHAESSYTIGQAPQQRENGTIELPGSASPHRELATHYLPNQRHAYNEAGWLMSTQYIPPPPDLAPKTVVRSSTEANATVTTQLVADTVTTIYLRNPDGQLRRQEQRSKAYRKWATQPFTAYEYLPNGLRRNRTDSSGSRYEYRYTFY
jgi:hypothetical protein